MGVAEKAQSLNPNLPLSAVIEKDSPSVDNEMTRNGDFFRFTSIDDVSSSLEELNQSPHQVSAEIKSNEDEVDYISSSLQSNTMMHETVELLSMRDNEQPQLILPPSEDEITLRSVDGGIENGSQTYP
ncbi:Hypothetical predicted protein [Olea europaea subsp. europaea]|uniref:Uncharacterized protein n=1 Tax=Olea europaea subsp. europaea TaxID=158383 RepID=A0A8S0TZF1_OLEEU|nr:Hypothetical predicted protein [Olea europaea subsp. europaea]